jgi:L-asparaginase
LKRIKLIAMGGTISAHHDSRIDFRNYVSGRYSGSDLIRAIPELQDIAAVDVEEMAGISSTLIDARHWLQLREKAHRYLNEEGYDGLVITHGTNTLEETAYFLHLSVNSNKPIVLTGSQRPPSSLGTDAYINILSAVRVASSGAAVGKGVLVVLNEQINGARDATKTNTYRLETFKSGEIGVLGHVDPDERVVFHRAPERRHTADSEFSRLEIPALPAVEIVYSYAGATGRVIRCLLADGAIDGIVVAGTGAGRCSGEEEAALVEAVAAGMPVVMSSRVGNGRVVPIEAYAHLRGAFADNLAPHKARILLMLALLDDRYRTDLQAAFDLY